MDPKEQIVGWIEDFAWTWCDEHNADYCWRRPLVGLADAESPLFPELRVTAYPGHRLPSDYLPGARTVISYFMPFTEDVVRSNREGGEPSRTWADAYKATNAMAKELNRHIAARLTGLGHRAAVPEDAFEIVDGTYSVWSQRHVARIAGLGSFGMNNMLITDSGCCGRFFSVITDMECRHDSPAGERCLRKLGRGCGACMRRCPAHALTDDGFLREACREYCDGNAGLYGVTVCGKCSACMPCSFRDPSA